MRATRTRTKTFAALAMAGTLILASCGDDSDDSVSSAPSSSAGGSSMMGATGPGCASVPTSGEGSFSGMADDPAATAASNNPLLSTLVTAVTAAGLVDTLNGTGPFTIFAPTNDAFAKIPKADLDAVLADKDLLTSVLTYHVVAGKKMSGADLVAAKKAETVNGGELTFASGPGGSLTINGDAATSVCWNVPTANATVHIIDTVLMPPS